MLVFRRKGISNRIQTEWNFRESYFWNKCDPGDLEWTSRKNKEATRQEGAPPPSWSPRSSTDLLLPPIYVHIPRKHPGAPRTLFPSPQPSVPKRSHLGAFSGAPPEGAFITEGLYINSMALIRLQRIYNFYCSMLYYLLFWTLLGFIIHFYIIFGTNLLIGGPVQNCCFLPISEFRRKGISNGVQTEWNLRERDFWNEHDSLPMTKLNGYFLDSLKRRI